MKRVSDTTSGTNHVTMSWSAVNGGNQIASSKDSIQQMLLKVTIRWTFFRCVIYSFSSVCSLSSHPPLSIYKQTCLSHLLNLLVGYTKQGDMETLSTFGNGKRKNSSKDWTLDPMEWFPLSCDSFTIQRKAKDTSDVLWAALFLGSSRMRFKFKLHL